MKEPKPVRHRLTVEAHGARIEVEFAVAGFTTADGPRTIGLTDGPAMSPFFASRTAALKRLSIRADVLRVRIVDDVESVEAPIIEPVVRARPGIAARRVEPVRVRRKA